MSASSDDYLLAGGSAELERLQLQARVWEPETEVMLDLIAPEQGWHCIDLGCGALGIVEPLSRRVGSWGRVVGVDRDDKQLAAVRRFVQESGLTNVEIFERDAYDTGLPRESFDFTHARFVFAPAGHDDQLLNEMIALTRPGGTIAIQEPDASSWNCYPAHPAWERLKAVILAAFSRGGGDFNAGQRTFGMLRRAGLKDVRIRAAVIALQGEHPYKKLPVQFAASLRKRILDAELVGESELDGLVKECDRIATEADTIVMSFIVTQVWGRKAA